MGKDRDDVKPRKHGAKRGRPSAYGRKPGPGARSKEEKGYYGSKLTYELIMSNIHKFRGNVTKIAEACSVSTDTIRNYRKHYPEIEEEIANARKDIANDIENAFFENALKGNIAAQIFYLKTRMNYVETRRLEADVTNKNIDLKDADEFRAQMDLWKASESGAETVDETDMDEGESSHDS